MQLQGNIICIDLNKTWQMSLGHQQCCLYSWASILHSKQKSLKKSDIDCFTYANVHLKMNFQNDSFWSKIAYCALSSRFLIINLHSIEKISDAIW